MVNRTTRACSTGAARHGCCSTARAAAAEGKKVALIIGNSAYATGPLRNPANDAADLAAALREIGFSVATGLDANRKTIPQASRGMERGLAVVGRKPPESVIVYSTEAGETADDGSRRNGVFTEALLRHIRRKEELTVILRER